ncbi:MAG: DUF1570 domain-containing protein [Pirellulaceae bacterium]|jgi:hypothetical protein|nr:DUF1570 domain-containing protein [Pirellulaceae bacterium]
MLRTFGRALAAAVILCGGLPAAGAAEPAMVQLHLAGQQLEGTAVAWSDTRVLLLSRNGFLYDFAPQQAADYRVLSPHFRPYSPSEMRSELHREFGSTFDVSGTGNYLVVHPAGQKDLWAARFENLYRSFVHYFTARGMRPTPPEFPLVAVVFPSRGEFVRYVQQTDGAAPPAGIVGFYSPRSNRVFLYDVTQGNASDAHWHHNASTIIHEATHQMAFNTGIHRRTAVPPRWAGEGLAMLFEAPGVWDPVRHPDVRDRINPERLAAFREYLRGRRPAGSVAQLVQHSDRLFASAPDSAYAEAWALTFYLSETQPAKYLQYLRQTAAREPLKRYAAPDQLREFTDVFGTDFTMLEARFLRFMEGL